MLDKRKIFFEELMLLAEQDEKVLLFVMDVGFSFTEAFQERFPKQYFNFGVTECSTVVIAAALALQGFKPYVYSMIPFVLFRPAEMVRNMVVNHNANVKLLGVKGSEKYKFLGKSHNLQHENEDVNFCANIGLPSIVTYGESEEAIRIAIQTTYKDERAVYIRL